MAVQSPAIPAAPAARAPRRADRNLFGRVRRHWADYLYILPAIAVMVIVIGYPLVYTIYRSFFHTSSSQPEWTWNGLSNYADILTRSSFWDVTWNTVVWTVGSTAIAVAMGFAAALVVNQNFIGRGMVRGILLIPWVISAVAAAYIWKWLVHSDYGLINNQLFAWGLIDEQLILVDSIDNVMPTLVVANVWKEFPFVMIMVLAGLQTVPDQLLRAARIDGASSWNQFRHIVLPHLKSVLIITTLLLAVANLNSFTLPFLMTGGGPAGASELWITDIYRISFGAGLRYGEASAYSVILFLIMAVLGYFYVRALTGGRPASGSES